MLAIETKYHGATNFRGARVSARVMERFARKVTIGWDDALGTDDNHISAARALILKLGWTAANGYGNWIAGSCESGYVLTCDTRHGGQQVIV